MKELNFDVNQTALVVIDMQNGIVGLPCEPYSATQVLTQVQRLVDSSRNAGLFVTLVNVDTKDGKDMLHPVTDAETSPSTAKRPEDWSKIVSELGPAPTDHCVTKHQWGAFYGTDLDLQLRRRGIDTIILCGIATDIGVETTAREAYQHGYNQIFVEDAMTALSKPQHEHPLKYTFPRMGRIRTTEEVLQALSE
ncbi:hydrolase [Alicyclobacillus sp. SO9]|uniref:hydrolase n=1 Tax=Alicyclobacillus sp. SO9 TaxID=2665646 RepID=UPI0018E81AE5|nr:hydrolase [Alicyclobacillus sp. SO9]QQE77523.1 hydrolase [Alicyclobacillus sp. SO9]